MEGHFDEGATSETEKVPGAPAVPSPDPSPENPKGKSHKRLWVTIGVAAVVLGIFGAIGSGGGSTTPEAASTDEPEMVELKEADKAALKASIEDARKLKADDYTEDSYQTLYSLLFTASDIYNDESATQDEVDKVRADVDAAVKALEKKPAPVDLSKLNDSISKAGSYSAEDYTDESWQSMQDSLANANAVAGNPESTQAQVNDARTRLDSAVKALEVRPLGPSDYEAVGYEAVARTPDDYKGSLLTFSGRVLQVIDGTSETDLRIATDGGYDDVILVGYDPSIMSGTRILEDDNVTVYGTCIGLYTYESTLGASISVPALYADSIAIN